MALRPIRGRARGCNEKGANIGFPVTATDRESPASSYGEKLTYWLTGDSATSSFSIDAANTARS